VLRLAVRVARAQAELVLAELLELAPSGVEEVDDGDVVEYAIYGAPGELPALPDLHAAAGAALVQVSTQALADDWSQRWREFHRPLVLGERLTVRPPWEPANGTAIDVVIDPGEAFGTGAHATTRLCLELMLEVAPPAAAGGFVDLGCGSGVLAVTAAKLGFAPVVALDNDPASVCTARRNARVNGVDVQVARLDLRRQAVTSAPTIAANLLAPLLVAWAPLAPTQCRCVIASGLLVQEAGAVADAFAAHGLIEVVRRTRGEWAALLLER
jgi:ribosomal protein L11 methyltransferase